jgi:hypothetical protein
MFHIFSAWLEYSLRFFCLIHPALLHNSFFEDSRCVANEALLDFWALFTLLGTVCTLELILPFD